MVKYTENINIGGSSMKVIGLVNQKGGVSKTTSTHNLGSALSQLGKKVLLIDLDPQGNLTSGVGIDKSEIKNCIYDLLIEDTVELEETIVSLEEFDIVPATIKLAIADSKLINEYARERKLLDKIENTDYDYVLIDCPPSLTILTINALVASDYVLIPVKMEKYAFDGIIHLGNTINSIKKLNKKLKILGAFATAFDKRIKLSQDNYDKLVRTFEGETVFETKISIDSQISYAQEVEKSIFQHNKSSKAAKDYMDLANEVIEKIGE